MFLPSFMKLSSADTNVQYAAAKEILALHKRFWPTILIVSAVVGVHSLFLFHRLFGPMYRFKKTLEDVAGGDISYNIKLRKRDFLKKEELVINTMISSLRDVFQSLRENSRNLAGSIDEMQRELEGSNISLEEVREKLNGLKEENAKIDQGLSKFKIT
jgi:methyl-accepting chemotaxis protein